MQFIYFSFIALLFANWVDHNFLYYYIQMLVVKINS